MYIKLSSEWGCHCLTSDNLYLFNDFYGLLRVTHPALETHNENLSEHLNRWTALCHPWIPKNRVTISDHSGYTPWNKPNNHQSSSSWWFLPSWKILVNGKDYPIYYGKYNHRWHRSPLLYWLVVSTPLKNMKVSWDDYSRFMFQTTNQTMSPTDSCSKPPTR